MSSDTPKRLRWLRWPRETQRAPHLPSTGAAPITTSAPSRRWLPFWRRGHDAVRERPADPVLQLVREWFMAQGAHPSKSDADRLWLRMPDGMDVRYTRSAFRARDDAAVTALTPGSPVLDELLSSIIARGVGQSLSVPPSSASPLALARAAFDGAGAVSEGAHPEALSTPSVVTGRLQGAQYTVAGLYGKGVRDAVLEHQWERRSIECTFQLTITSFRGRREELIRLGVDPESGEMFSPVPATLLRAATAHDSSTHIPPDLAEPVRRAAAHLDPALRAALHLARLQVLPDYQRRQDDIESTFARLLIESPDAGSSILAARERELARLAETHAVEIETRLVNVAAISTPCATVRVHFVGGGEAKVAVDLARESVHAPQCQTCGNTWRAGGRCAEGHVTCLACQRQCAHCGVRWCPLCSTPALSACSICGQMSCARCAKSAARGRHRVRVAAAPQPDIAAADHSLTPADVGADASRDASDLSIDDLDAMSPATWRTCVLWLIEGLGYADHRDLPAGAGDLALVCGKAGNVAHPLVGLPARADAIVVLAHRPHLGERESGDRLRERARKLARQMPNAAALVISTSHLTTPHDASVSVLDRDALKRLLAERATQYRRERRAAHDEMEERAVSAARVRTALIEGLQAAHSALAGGQSSLGSSGADPLAAHPVDQAVSRAVESAQVVRQALAALETLVDEWERSFSSVPTREAALAISADVAAFAQQETRATYLAAALLESCETLVGVPVRGGAAIRAWYASLIEELGLHCQALEQRCAALDPVAWRSFPSARDAAAADRAAQTLASSARVALRVNRLRDELEAHHHSGEPASRGARE